MITTKGSLAYEEERSRLSDGLFEGRDAARGRDGAERKSVVRQLGASLLQSMEDRGN